MGLVLILLSLACLTRFIPHVPNFTPVVAVALFAGFYLKRTQALIVPLVLMAVTDYFLGFHSVMAFTWGSVLLVSLIGLSVRKGPRVISLFFSSIGSAVLFFLVTNLGVWFVHYPQTWAGLQECFTLAMPFFRMTLASTLVYTVVLFAGYELLAAGVRRTRLAPVLLK